MSAAAHTLTEEGRMHRVTLCVMTFSEVDVRAHSVEAAFRQAQAAGDGAALKFRTEAVATRAEVCFPVDPRDLSAGFKWVEMVREFANGKDSRDGFHWVAKIERR